MKLELNIPYCSREGMILNRDVIAEINGKKRTPIFCWSHWVHLDFNSLTWGSSFSAVAKIVEVKSCKNGILVMDVEWYSKYGISHDWINHDFFKCVIRYRDVDGSYDVKILIDDAKYYKNLMEIDV